MLFSLHAILGISVTLFYSPTEVRNMNQLKRSNKQLHPLLQSSQLANKSMVSRHNCNSNIKLTFHKKREPFERLPFFYYLNSISKSPTLIASAASTYTSLISPVKGA